MGGTFFARNDVIEQALLTGELPEEKRHLLENRLIENKLIGVPLKYWRDVVEQLAASP